MANALLTSNEELLAVLQVALLALDPVAVINPANPACLARFGVIADFPDVCVICPKGTFSSGPLEVGAAQAPPKPSLAPCTPCCDPSMPASSCDLTTKAPGAQKYQQCVKRPSPPTPSPPPTVDFNFTLPPDFLPSMILKPIKKATRELKIGCILPLGNGSAPEDISVATAVLVGVQMAIKDTIPDVLPRYFVNLTVFNTKCEGMMAAEGVKYLAAEGVSGIIGDVCSTSSLAAAAANKALQIPILSPAATSPSLSMKDFFFRTVANDIFQAFAASSLMFEDFGAKQIGVVYEANAYGFGLVDNLAPNEGDSSVVARYEFAPGNGDAEKAVQAMIEARDDPMKVIDAVFLAMNDVGFAAQFLLESRKQGLSLPLYGGDTLTTPTLLEAVLGQESDIDQLTCISINPGHANFIEKFAKVAPKVKFEPYAAPAYDATVALLKGFKDAAGPKTPTNIGLAIRDEIFEGVTGPVQFDIFGDIVPHAESYVYGQFNRGNGKFELIGFTSK
eukprot:gene3309-3585_t